MLEVHHKIWSDMLCLAKEMSRDRYKSHHSPSVFSLESYICIMLLGCRDDKAESKYDDAFTGFMHIYLYLYLATTTHIERPAKSHLEKTNLFSI